MLKINLGSGPTSAAGWENIDWGILPLLGMLKINILLSKLKIIGADYGVVWPKIRLWDIRKGLPFMDNKVSYIYCSNVLEHLQPRETIKVVTECYRVLKKGGKLRVVIPDLDILIKKYKDPDTFNNEYWGYEKKKYRSFREKVMERFIRPHQWMFNKKSFRNILVEASFSKIKFYGIGKGKCPDLNRLDLKIHEELCFYVEAEK
jgi:predicted SAM-dependent methyltransferase